MDKRSKNVPKFGAAKPSFTPNLGYKRLINYFIDKFSITDFQIWRKPIDFQANKSTFIIFWIFEKILLYPAHFTTHSKNLTSFPICI